ncbi:MAG: anthranilate phosphoribosyltransferase [Actinomycetota bacterium]
MGRRHREGASPHHPPAPPCGRCGPRSAAPGLLSDTEFPGWPAVLGRFIDGDGLGRELARASLTEILAGRATDAQISAWIIGLRLAGEQPDELAGLVDAMLDVAEPIELATGAIDIVGTGGAPSRRRHALSVSTMSCFVAAAAGARVCKHGNVKASATSGSFDTLAALGVTTDLGAAGVATCVEEAGVGFVFARRFHPAMRHVGPVRAELGVPTVFNVLGPLANPARVRHHLIGVSDPRLLDTVAEVLRVRGSERAWIVHGDDGLDELTTTTTSTVVELRDGEVRRFTLDPSNHGIAPATLDDLAGGGPEDNARIAGELFGGAEGARADIVALNSGAALVVAGLADDLDAGIAAARTAMADGSAAATLAKVVEVSAVAGG